MGLQLPMVDPNSYAELWGDGGDGAVVVAAPAALVDDVNYTNLTVNAALTTANFIIRCRGTLNVGAAGTIINNGNAAGVAPAGPQVPSRDQGPRQDCGTRKDLPASHTADNAAAGASTHTLL